MNLITIDHFATEGSTSGEERAADPQAAVRFYVDRGDFKKDATWKWQPWGQFVVAAVSLKLFGANTVAARLPFALAGILTVLILYRFALRYFEDSQLALLATVLLIFNAYWILHSRQCRYYALSSLFLMLTLASYGRWQSGSRRGATLFVVSAWCWFQVDYGTVWPVLAVLFADALIAQRQGVVQFKLRTAASCRRPAFLPACRDTSPRRTDGLGDPSLRLKVGCARDDASVRPINATNSDCTTTQRRNWWHSMVVGIALAAAIAPFAVYYEIWGRVTVPLDPWFQRFARNLFNINEYVVPMLIVTAAIVIWLYRKNTMPHIERRLIAISFACLITMLLWVPAVAPAAFLRYSILMAPLGCLLTAWVLLQVGKLTRPSLTWIGAAIFLLTPGLSLPLPVLPHTPLHATVIRPGLKLLRESVFGHPPDPDGPVIECLRANAAPSDEILINYEDIPLMFYLPNPIRGGITAFRAEDDAKGPPQFVVLRHSVNFVHWPVFEEEIQRYTWKTVRLEAPDIICGSCPDPVERYDASHAASIFIAHRVGESETARR